MTEHEYFDDDSTNIDDGSIEKEKQELVKKTYNEFMYNLTLAYNAVSMLPREIQLEALMNIMADI